MNPTPPTPPPPLLRLPPELLLQILRLVIGTRPTPGVCLWNHGPQTISPWCGPRRLGPTTIPTALLLVCRAFYHAGIEAYYGNVVFKFLSPEHLRAAVGGLGERRAGWIRCVVVNVEFEAREMVKAGGEGREAVYFPRSQPDFEMDVLAALRGLRTARVMVGVPEVQDGGDKERAMKVVEQRLRRCWSSGKDTIEITWFWRSTGVSAER